MTEAVSQDTPLSAAEKVIFGADAKRDAAGKIIEQGFGSIARKSEKIFEIEKPAEEAAKVHLTVLEERVKEELARAKAEGVNLLDEAAAALKKVEDDF